MSYREALEAAGFTVHAYKSFGSYSGMWCADVTNPEGERGFIQDWYGSCTHCDAFLSDVGYEPWDEDDKEDQEIYRLKVKRFGRRYLDSMVTPETLIPILEQDADWNTDAEEALGWVKKRLDESV